MNAVTCRFSLAKAGASASTRRIVLAVSTLAVWMLAFAAPASATTETFNYTGAAQTWTVPAGITEASFDLYGAQGEGQPDGIFAAGLGGRATATISVTPGASIQVNVGGRGGHGSPWLGGFNGGGNGAPNFDNMSGGGGASDIRIGGTALTDRVLVAGGGGGAGPQGGPDCSVAGGGGGGLSGLPSAPGCPDQGSIVGGGGTQTDGGSAGGEAQPGAFGVGGMGGPPTPNGAGGPGGGGGWYGGGGGAETGGGGGSGHGPSGTVFETGVGTSDGLVTVTYTPTVDTLIQSVQAFALPSGITASLLTKLNTAEDNLDAGNAAGACNQLGAFVAQVKRQSGMKIPAAAADQLTSATDEVRTSLSCGAAQTCAGQQATIVGTAGPNTLKATAGDDVIAALGGDDRVLGLKGDDLVCGGAGADLLRGQGGDDTLSGGRGKDELRGGGGSNRCRGGKGSDTKLHC